MSKTKTTCWQNIKHRLLLLCPPRSRKYVTNIVEFKDKPHKILCASSSGIGDFVMVAPAIQALKEKFPNSKMVYLAHYNYGGYEVSKLIPAIDHSIDITLKKYRFASVTYMLWQYWKVLHCLRRENCDLAIVFTPNYILRWLLAGLNCKNWIYGNTISGYPGTIASGLLKLVNINEQPKSNVFDIPAPVRAKELLPANLPRPLISIHPFCGFDWMQWKKFEELQRQLCKLNGTVVVVGEKKDAKAVEGTHNLINKLSIAELFWVIKQCDFLITADSGPMHIAFAMGTPTVALFGFINPVYRTLAAGMEKHRILYYPTEKSERPRKMPHKTIYLENLQKISVEEVIAALKDLIAKSKYYSASDSKNDLFNS